MADTMRFAVDPLPGGSAAVGEEVTFREEGGKLYALNEDGEPFWQRSLGIKGKK